MVMVGVDSGSPQADSQPKKFGISNILAIQELVIQILDISNIGQVEYISVSVFTSTCLANRLSQ